MQKKLYKIEEGKKLCAGSGILAYIIAALVIPNKGDVIKKKGDLR